MLLPAIIPGWFYHLCPKEGTFECERWRHSVVTPRQQTESGIVPSKLGGMDTLL